MRVLAVAAHPDDEILGCGATLRRLVNEGHEVFTCVLCSTADARHNRPDDETLKAVAAESNRLLGITESVRCEFKNIQFNVVPHLELVREVEAAIRRFRPEWVFTHHSGDLNIDHRICYEATMAAVRLPQRLSSDLPPTLIRKVFLYEVLSSTDWAAPVDPPFLPNSFFSVAETFDVKLKALDVFEGALKPFPHSRSRENVRHLAHLRGAQVGIDLAEAYCLVRDLNV